MSDTSRLLDQRYADRDRAIVRQAWDDVRQINIAIRELELDLYGRPALSIVGSDDLPPMLCRQAD